MVSTSSWSRRSRCSAAPRHTPPVWSGFPGTTTRSRGHCRAAGRCAHLSHVPRRQPAGSCQGGGVRRSGAGHAGCLRAGRISSPTSWPPPGPTITPTSRVARRAAVRWFPTSTTAASSVPGSTRLRPALKTMMPLGGMMVGRNDLPHVFKMTQSAKSALHVARMVARHARDRLSYSRGTRLVNGNALIARAGRERVRARHPAVAVVARVELVTRCGPRYRARSSSGRAQRVRCRGTARRGAGLRRLPGERTLSSGKSMRISPPARTTSGCRRPGNTGDGLRLAQAAGWPLPRRGAPAGCLDAGVAGATAGRLHRSVPAFLRSRQAWLHQRRPARQALRQ